MLQEILNVADVTPWVWEEGMNCAFEFLIVLLSFASLQFTDPK